MVNRGRSGGCITCKKGRVKCGEEKPVCMRCRRLGLSCGYKVKLKFREQNYKFMPVEGDNDVDARGRMVTIPHSLRAPDTSIEFYLRYYAGYGRKIEHGRGFFEFLVPIYRSSEHSSALSHAVSALASLAWSVWRYGNHSNNTYQNPRNLYANAVASLRGAIADSEQVNKPGTLLAVLALQTFENVVAVYGLRLAAHTHHDGAISLLSLAESSETNTVVSAYVRRFVLHAEICSALRRQRPIQNTVNACLKISAPTIAPYNPSAALDNIGASIAELQAAHVEVSRCISLLQAQESLRAEVKKIDEQLLAWEHSIPAHWKPIRLISGHGFDASIPSYLGLCDDYSSCQIANLWNLWRLQRLVLINIMLSSWETDFSTNPLRLGEETQESWHLGTAQQSNLYNAVQDLVDAVCRSVPFYLGNRTMSMGMADFTDPHILLPSCPSAARVGHGNYGQNCDPDMSPDDHRGHIIAQGPWHLMSPLSRLLTLFADNEVIESVLRPRQRQWIRAQFLRVLTLLHIHQTTDDTGSNFTADFLAKQVRKGAMFMSGP